jgi:hypothetical protein
VGPTRFQFRFTQQPVVKLPAPKASA